MKNKAPFDKQPFADSSLGGDPFAARRDADMDAEMARFENALESTVLDKLPEKPVSETYRAKYEMINGLRREALTELITELPASDTTLYILSNGAGAERQDGSDRLIFDFGAFVPVLVDLVGAGCDLYISTWTINRRGALALANMLRTGKAKRLTIAVDQYFNKRAPHIAKILFDAIRETGRGDYVTFRNHAKVLVIEGSVSVVITGSANLSSQPRVEQYTLTTNPDVANFFKKNLFLWAIKNSMGVGERG